MMAPNSSASAASAGERAEIAVHAEDAVGDDELALPGGQVTQNRARRLDVLVRKHLDRGAAQPAAVDDARVIQLVGDDDVVFREDRLDGAGVRGKTALKDDGGFGALEGRQPPFELDMDRHRARDRAD